MTVAAEHNQADEGVDVEEAARVRLQLSPYRAIRRCSCTFDGEILRLQGHVPTYHYKQLAQVAVVGLEGVRSIVNEIQVDTTP
jgi:osmotically-inducible protein OsmY